MKLVKLSLAAIVAVGAMATFSSAKPLEEAIKGVEVSGFARYRFYLNDGDVADLAAKKQANRFQGLLNLASPVTDDLKFGISLAYNPGKEFAQNDAMGFGSPVVNKFWFQYAINNFTVKAGKIEIPSPWTDSGYAGSRGNGVLTLFTGVENWTFAGAYYNQTNLKPKGLDIGEEDLVAAGAVGKIGPVGVQAWAARMEHIVDWAAFAQVDVDIEGINGKIQGAMLKVDKSIQNEKRRGLFYGATAGYKNDQFSVDLGYTKNSNKQPIYAFVDGSDGFIEFGKQLGEHKTFNTADMRTIFVEGGFYHEKFGFEGGYGIAKSGRNYGNKKYNEAYAQVSYNYAKNFGLQLYYSILDAKGKVEDNNELRFQAQYKF